MMPSMKIFLVYAMPVTLLMFYLAFNKFAKSKPLKKKVFLFSILGLIFTFVDFFYFWYLGFPSPKDREGLVLMIHNITFGSTQACILIAAWHLMKVIDELEPQK